VFLKSPAASAARELQSLGVSDEPPSDSFSATMPRLGIHHREKPANRVPESACRQRAFFNGRMATAVQAGIFRYRLG